MSRLRDARPADLDALTRLESRCFGAAAWSRAAVGAELVGVGETRHVVVAVEETGDLIGYAVLLYAGGLADVQRVAVDPAHRRRGHAGDLLDRLVERAARERCERVLLEAAVNNEAALALYASRGFVEIDRRRRYYPGGVDAVVMQRVLEGGP